MSECVTRLGQGYMWTHKFHNRSICSHFYRLFHQFTKMSCVDPQRNFVSFLWHYESFDDLLLCLQASIILNVRSPGNLWTHREHCTSLSVFRPSFADILWEFSSSITSSWLFYQVIGTNVDSATGILIRTLNVVVVISAKSLLPNSVHLGSVGCWSLFSNYWFSILSFICRVDWYTRLSNLHKGLPFLPDSHCSTTVLSPSLTYKHLPIWYWAPMFSRAVHTIRLAVSASYKEPLATEVFEPIITSYAANKRRPSGKMLHDEAAIAEIQYVTQHQYFFTRPSYSYIRAGVHWSPYEDPTQHVVHLTIKFLDANDTHLTTQHIPIHGTKRAKPT